jgi:hypothetical protein
MTNSKNLVRNREIHLWLKKGSNNQKKISSFVEFFSSKCSNPVIVVLKYRLLQLLQFRSVEKKVALFVTMSFSIEDQKRMYEKTTYLSPSMTS